jgi:hypothetical protein
MLDGRPKPAHDNAACRCDSLRVGQLDEVRHVLLGIRVNLGKRSASLSVGVRGAHVTLRPPHKVRATVGLARSGLRATEGGGVRQPHVPVPNVLLHEVGKE